MPNDPKAGALNLLKKCLNVQAEESVLLVLEPTNEFYAHEVAVVMRQCLHELNACVTELTPPLINDPVDFPLSLSDTMKLCDHTLFLSRVGDYVRFVPLPGSASRATSYALNNKLLGSPYATIDNQLMHRLQQMLEDELMQADSWRIQCPLGTDITGGFCWPSLTGGQDDSLTIDLFPVSTFKPVPCGSANGRVALSRWLMPGGAVKLVCADLTINGVVFAHVEDGYLDSFSGADDEVERVNRHYDYVSQALGVNRNRIHSWHAGINPQTWFDQPVDECLDLWSAISFGSPKYLHFHTCGDDPPGEVAWSVFNPTITVDGVVYWKNGEIVWMQRPDIRALIESCDGAHYLLQPSLTIGID